MVHLLEHPPQTRNEKIEKGVDEIHVVFYKKFIRDLKINV